MCVRCPVMDWHFTSSTVVWQQASSSQNTGLEQLLSHPPPSLSTVSVYCSIMFGHCGGPDLAVSESCKVPHMGQRSSQGQQSHLCRLDMQAVLTKQRHGPTHSTWAQHNWSGVLKNYIIDSALCTNQGLAWIVLSQINVRANKKEGIGRNRSCN